MVKLDRTAAAEEVSTLEGMIAERNKILAELYCVSRLHDFLSITDEQALQSQIDIFLEANDIRKGHHFDSNTLPKFTQVEFSPDKRASKSKSSTPVDSARKEREHTKHERDERSFDREKESGKDFRAKISQDVRANGGAVQSSPSKADGIELELEKLPNGTGRTQISSNKRPREDERIQSNDSQVFMKEEHAPATPGTPQPPHTAPKRQRLDRSSIKSKKAPTKLPKKRLSSLLKELQAKPRSTKELFHQDNINAKESVFLIMNDKVPSKIPHAVPLSELKYNAQTLPLIKLIPTAHKVLTTDIMNTALNECRIAVVSSRIEELRRLGLWSLRQPKKFLDPFENKKKQTHWGKLLEEAEWISYDFDEFKKYKIAVCLTIAQSVMDFWHYGKTCCVNVNPTKPAASPEVNTDPAESDLNGADVSLPDSEGEVDHSSTENLEQTPTIDTKVLLQESTQQESIIPTSSAAEDYTPPLEHRQRTPSPFKLHVSFSDFSLVERKILNDFPLMGGLEHESSDCRPQGVAPFDPISKATVMLDDDQFVKLVERQLIDEEPSLVPFSKRRGMFYGNRRSHYLRPPIAPSLRYLRYRTPTIWLPEDDQELVRNINTYAYNWELISAHISSRPTRSYCSNIERRTPWQCFERFVQLNERFQFIDMKGPRAHSAQMWLIEAHKLQQQQKRRISPLGVGEDSIQRGHRRLRWASMFEAMRKCFKKRENAPKPNPTQPRKPLDCKNTSVPTPAEMSQLKAQRDDALRRDIQMRRIAKQKLQAAAMGQSLSSNNASKAMPKSSPPSGQRRVPDSARGSIRGSSPENSVRITTQTPQQTHIKQLSESEFVESYARKILLQKPDFSPELALKAAKSQFKLLAVKQQQQQQQQQLYNQQTPHRSDGLSRTPYATLKTEPSNEKILSPTPQDILQKMQQSKH
ncbi:LAQU0S04e01046g1_1 [Lachancea quebecensis]|uniref:Chromatin modification-related protein EAF1 n=1 Tax=Lachancea quebecensis TaxID=1654605 RepID=A0A0P1KQ68_9SACH|nr:LAQU0S04e01046g1_1 [Lachancea quebecensis]